MANYKQLCAELLDELQYQTGLLMYHTGYSVAEKLKKRARAALAESEPEPPRDKLMADYKRLLRTSPPWKEAPTLPKGHEILAEFPAVLWGWECDMYYWIIRDPSSRVYVGATSHGMFYEAKPDRLAHQINELNSYIEATQQALSMFKAKGEEMA